MRVLSLANPEAPLELSHWPAGPGIPTVQQYVHDCVMVGTRMYASAVYVGTERVIDLTDPAAPTEIGRAHV